jgi:hypothetical protein
MPEDKGTPTNEPSFTQGGAPGGKSMGDDLPSVAVPGGKPFSTGGYTPQADQDQLPTPGSTEGEQKAPSGTRR